ncbi:hypothetical protein MLD38_038959 [Melastoma candidum]|uniref:Uncharacterized protein n=1 Tax=Melastoma candidum TaxID=119954 RepID=A0ACB9L2W9_9MYRT|nr:hypothetical protein MLD38_038959 [Melastoma candidum]
MGASLSACFRPPSLHVQPPPPPHTRGHEWSSSLLHDPLDETLGHSFCYLPSSNRCLLHSPSDSLRFDRPSPASSFPTVVTDSTETALFKSISGASVGANASVPPSVTALHLHNPPDYAEDHSVPPAPASGFCSGGGLVRGNVFEGTSSFRAVELQPVPRGEDGFFLSGPIERGAMSGPLVDGWPDGTAGPHIHFSAPLGGVAGDHGGMPGGKKRRRKKRGGMSGIRNSLAGGFAEKKWVVPVRSFSGSKEAKEREIVKSINFVESNSFARGGLEEENVEWASGKAGEDRVQVVVSEEQGWLFVGIYDGFNGPDAPEFLMDRLYRAVYLELQGLFWEDVSECSNDKRDGSNDGSNKNPVEETVAIAGEASVRTDDGVEAVRIDASKDGFGGPMERRVKFESGVSEITLHRRCLWEFLADEDAEDGLDLSGSQRFAFSVDDAINVSNVEGSGVTRRRLLLSKLKHGLKDGHAKRLFPWRFGLKEKVDEVANNIMEEKDGKRRRRRKEGPVDHQLVLRAMSRALDATEAAYLEMSGKVIDTHPELALMGSCLLVALMRDEDIYIMNVGDSRAIVAQLEERVVSSLSRDNCKESTIEGIAEAGGSRGSSGRYKTEESEVSTHAMRLAALQLSTDHSTSIEEEVTRIKNEHPEDSQCIVNGRVKGRLKVTRAFGAGFLKQPKLNAAVLEMFRNEYIGTAPYLSCTPALRHHKLCPRDQFLILSSDGLYQYLTNEEVVAHVESFMEKFPEGDPAQHLIEEVLSRAAKKAGMGFRELLDVPQGDRRKYHDDVMVMVVSLEGRIWKSSGKYMSETKRREDMEVIREIHVSETKRDSSREDSDRHRVPRSR